MLKAVDQPFAGSALDGFGVRPVVGRGLGFERRGRTLLDIDEFAADGLGVTVLMGPNGAGKSLLLKCLANLVAPDAGAVTWAGRPPDRVRAASLGFVFQKPVLLRRSAHANIRHALRITGVPRREAAARAERALADAGLAHLAGMPARVLSGGEQQRVAIARAMALRPECLFLDEPTANLDPASVAAIEATALAASCGGVKVVFVTHDAAQARRIAADVVFMNGGRIVEHTEAARFFDEPQSRAARAFLAGELLAA
jgi:tungstate transport system ATP-binding protein